MFKSLLFVSAALFATSAMANDPGAQSALSMQDPASVPHAIDQDHIVAKIGSGTSGGRGGSSGGSGGRKGGR